jgi:hypothetical protein
VNRALFQGGFIVTWLKRLLWSPPAAQATEGLDVYSAIGTGVAVTTAYGKVVVGVRVEGGDNARLCVLSPAAARALAFELWYAARTAALERVH